MELTIYNTYVVMESQEQCDRMKQLCIDNNLPIYDYKYSFEYDACFSEFSFFINKFFIGINKYSINNMTQVTEQEFINLLNKHNEKKINFKY